jgi:hypothetical protein
MIAVCCLQGAAQQYTSMSGLIHVPSADMDPEGSARIGGHFLNREFVPERFFAVFNQGKYNTFSHYLSITPFPWLEIGYTSIAFKHRQRYPGETGYTGSVGYYDKDRHISLKLRPVQEAKWWPSIAIGADDPYSTSGAQSTYYSNFYMAATKHFDLKGNSLGIHLAYRKWKQDYNRKWNGTVGGITFRPFFAGNLRVIAEYTGNDVNVGFDWMLFKHILLQSSLQNGTYFTGGLCFYINLL